MSVNDLFNRSFTDSVLSAVEPTKPYVIPASSYPPCPDCGSPSGMRTSSRGRQEYICKNLECRRNFSESTKHQPRKKLNNPPCPDCGSSRVHRKGTFEKTGEFKYRCYDCLNNFRESTKDIKSDLFERRNRDLNYKIPSCPECGGQNLQKRGFERNKDKTMKQKFRCNDCNKSFCESSSNRPNCPECQESNWVLKRGATVEKKQRFFCQKCELTFVPLLNPPCPDCGSFWIRKAGKEKKTKEQKYQCNDCRRTFNESTKNTPSPKYDCPPCIECGSQETLFASKNKYGTHRYKCKSCRTNFLEHRDNPPCPDCQSLKIIKAGRRRGQQEYRCQNCQRRFAESTKNSPIGSPNIFNDSDHWDLREMGGKFPLSASWFTANFEKFKIKWLKEVSKKYVKHLLIGNAGSTCLNKLQSIFRFSEFLAINYPDCHDNDLNREIIVHFHQYLAHKYSEKKSNDLRRVTIKDLDEIIKLSCRFDWLEIQNSNLIYPEDLPKLQKSGKTFDQVIPDEVLEQLVDNLDGLPIVFSRMAFLMLGVPIRVSEVCGMRFNCIKQDKDGDWWLNFWDYKINKEHNPVPIRQEVADMIKLQQKFIRDKFGKDYTYLFCAKNSAARKDGTYRYTDRPPSAASFRDALKKLVKDRNITCQGELYLDLSKTHQFRHTGASDLINKGMPLVMVQEILGHETPEMTLVYAKLYDDTLKEAWKEVAPQIVNITGKITKLNPKNLDSKKHQEMKRIALEQQVNNGTCGLSVHQKCPKFHACYTCSKFNATRDNLPGLKTDREQLKDEVDRLKEQRNSYKQESKLRLAEGCRDRIKQSQEIIQNLNNMITALENEAM